MPSNQTDSDYRDSHKSSIHAAKYESLVIEGSYNSALWEWEQEILHEAIQQLPKEKNSKCLDFACGTGRIIRLLEKHYSDVTGLDISDSMLARAREKSPNTKFVSGDASRDTTLLNDTFDLVTSFRFFLNAQDDLRQAILNFLSQKIAVDGTFIFNIHLQHNSIQHRLLRLWWGISGKPQLPSLSIVHMEHLLEEVGVDIVDVKHFGVLPVSNRLLPLPKPLYKRVERWLSRKAATKLLARNVVCICKKRKEV